MRAIRRTTCADLVRALVLATAMLGGVLALGARQSAAQQATPVPVAEAAPGAAQELIANGSFEQNTGWHGSRTVEYNQDVAYTGSRALHLPAAADNFAYQTITMPQRLDAAVLRFAWTVAAADPPRSLRPLDGDTLRAALCPVDDERCRNHYGMTSVLTDTGGGWQMAELVINEANLQRLPGQEVNVVFFKQQDNTAPAAVFYVDDVSLLVDTGIRTQAIERIYLPLVVRS
jgi:hypothetical protein